MASDEQSAKESSHGYIEDPYGDGPPAEKLRLKCHDCFETWVQPNTKTGLDELEWVQGRHISDEARTACHHTKIEGVWPDGSVADV